jgi:DNA polymerase III alpha subunit (gram-positive type)
MRNYSQFILEHKFWGKSITEFLNWIKGKSNKYFVLLDTETTGLISDPYEVQLTQISCIVIKYDYDSNSFKEIDTYNRKLKLTDTSLALMKKPQNNIKRILSFNHYGQKGIQFHDESETLQDFFQFLKQFDESILMIQNAEFDMRFLNTRNPIVKFDNEVIDTKQVAQLFYLPLLQKLAETDPEFREMVQKIGTSDRDKGLISSSLSKIGPALGINMTGYHDALTDTKLMMQMFQSMIEFMKQHQDVDIQKYQIERIKTKR